MAGKQTHPRVYQQFRAEAIRLVAEHPERTKSSIARELGVDPKTLNARLNAEKKRSVEIQPGLTITIRIAVTTWERNPTPWQLQS